MSSIKYFSTCSLSGEVTEDLSDQYFKIVVGHISSDLYFKICFLADLMSYLFLKLFGVCFLMLFLMSLLQIMINLLFEEPMGCFVRSARVFSIF